MTDPAPDAPSHLGAPGRRPQGANGNALPVASRPPEAGRLADVLEGRVLEGNVLDGHEEGFLAEVCHAVRTPLNGILGSLELLLEADISEEAHLLASAAFDAALDLHRVFESQIDAAVRPA